jgi:catechol 2,3-dioxygenase-like lactoylglutathione lyase family enzyme
MAQVDVSIPTLPARDLDETIAFWGRLGFEPVFRTPDPEGYAILRRGSLEVHFFAWPELDADSNYTGCYLRVADVDAMYQSFASADLPARGIPCLAGIEKKFYKMREFRLVDPNGNLVRVGEPIRARRVSAAQRSR